MTKTAISTEFPYDSHYVDIDGAKMHYIKQGEGSPILFLHGVPTSSYVWRNVIPHLASLGCCIAPDLLGFGKSAKPDIEYSIADHIHAIEKFINTLQLDHLTIVMHGWGSIMGFDYAMRHEKKCKGLVFYESYLQAEDHPEIPLPYQEQIMLWQQNTNYLLQNGVEFVNNVLAQSTMRPLSEKEMNYYREPFVPKGSGKALLRYLADISEKGDLHKVITAYSQKLKKSNLPKLMLYSVPGFLTTMTAAMWAKKNLPNLEVVDVGEELHYIQESNPALMGEAISIWLQGLEVL